MGLGGEGGGGGPGVSLAPPKKLKAGSFDGDTAGGSAAFFFAPSPPKLKAGLGGGGNGSALSFLAPPKLKLKGDDLASADAPAFAPTIFVAAFFGAAFFGTAFLPAAFLGTPTATVQQQHFSAGAGLAVEQIGCAPMERAPPPRLPKKLFFSSATILEHREVSAADDRCLKPLLATRGAAQTAGQL